MMLFRPCTGAQCCAVRPDVSDLDDLPPRLPAHWWVLVPTCRQHACMHACCRTMVRMTWPHVSLFLPKQAAQASPATWAGVARCAAARCCSHRRARTLAAYPLLPTIHPQSSLHAPPWINRMGVTVGNPAGMPASVARSACLKAHPNQAMPQCGVSVACSGAGAAPGGPPVAAQAGGPPAAGGGARAALVWRRPQPAAALLHPRHVRRGAALRVRNKTRACMHACMHAVPSSTSCILHSPAVETQGLLQPPPCTPLWKSWQILLIGPQHRCCRDGLHACVLQGSLAHARGCMGPVPSLQQSLSNVFGTQAAPCEHPSPSISRPS